MILNGQTSSFLYWVGAAIVISSFVFISQESKKNEKVTEHLELRASDLLIRNDQEME